ncbi:biopolymer transporter ExbD [Actibacterium sp. D379-3]
MTSLIDVIFLLLLFFMLSSTFSRYSQIDLAVVRRGMAEPSGTRPIFLRLTGAGLSLNGRALSSGDAATAIAAMRDTGQARMLLSVGADATAQQLADALLVLRAVPDATLSVIR